MKKFIFLFILLFSILFIFKNEPVYSWGFFAHKKINRMAVFTLPEGMIGFYKNHIEYITEHAVDPDKRRYRDVNEAPRHYIDIDHYGKYGYDSVPHTWKNAVVKYTEDTLKANGILPWHIEVMMYRLTEAFKNENLDMILHYSADIGHYIADAHVPLHTAENYNGQLSNQKGIHGFWESRIPELKSESYDYWVGQAKYIEKPLEKAWDIVKESHLKVDSVLGFEAALNSKYPSDKKYSYEKRGSKTIKAYSLEYTNEYDRLLNGMVEHRMRAAMVAIGSLWYTAWVNAGKPDLYHFNGNTISDSLKVSDQHIEEMKEIKGHDDQ